MDMTLTIIRGAETTVTGARPGEKLITALERAGIAVSAPCGGRCFCGKCLVRVDGAAGEILAAERKFINDDMLKDGSFVVNSGKYLITRPHNIDVSLLERCGLIRSQWSLC